MINSEQKLNRNIFNPKKLELEATRDGFGKGLVDAGRQDKRVVAVSADVTESVRCHWFKEEFPDRYIEVGVAEQNLATVSSGLANFGKIPFMVAYATFSPGRNNEQIRTTISINQLPVKIIGSHTGVSVGPDGATHQALEDIALMRVQPNMEVVVPADSVEAKKATIAAVKTDKPIYIRLTRQKTPVFTTEATPFKIGKANILFKGKDVTIIACGHLVYQALVAAKKLKDQGISCEVINNSSIKPLDKKTILQSIKKTKVVVTAEEHQVAGGMGSAVCEMLATNYPVPVEMVGMQDEFGESGFAEELLKKYSLDSVGIIKAVKKVIKKK